MTQPAAGWGPRPTGRCHPRRRGTDENGESNDEAESGSPGNSGNPLRRGRSGASGPAAGLWHRGGQAGLPTVYLDTDSPGRVSGLGIEAQDIASMVDVMVRHMLASPAFAGAGVPPRVIVDAEYFQNQSQHRIDKNLLINRLLARLHAAANGRIVFVNRWSMRWACNPITRSSSRTVLDRKSRIAWAKPFLTRRISACSLARLVLGRIT